MILAYPETEICAAYLGGLSSHQAAIHFSCSQKTVLNILKRNGVPSRKRTVANALRWEETAFRQNQVAKRTGKPSGAFGKRWIVGRIVSKPSLHGAGNPQWRGGTTALGPKIRQLSAYRVWRRAVFVRENFTCQDCGIRGCRLDAEHHRTFASIIHDFNVRSVEDALACDALWDVSNGKALCRKCHRKTPTFGVKRKSIPGLTEESRRAA
jgi:hypothetical protein